MNVYVAAAFDEKATVLETYDTLIAAGHTITADWTKHLPVKPYDHNRELATDYAVEDMRGVSGCEVFIVLTSNGSNTGMYIELGAAIMSALQTGRPRIFAIGAHNTRALFYFHPTVTRVASIDDVLGVLS